MRTPPPAPTTCRLCSKPATLKNSHIFPKMFVRAYASAIETGTHDVKQPASILISTVPGIESGQKQHGIFERELGIVKLLLCEDCEQQFGRYESWFRQNFYIGSRARVFKKPITSRTRTAEYQPFKLFVLSLLWRASVACGVFFRNVSLGAEHEQKLASALLTEAAGPESFYEFAVFDLRLDGYTMEDFVEEPHFYQQTHVCALYVGGFMFLIHVSDGSRPTPKDLRESAFVATASSRSSRWMKGSATVTFCTTHTKQGLFRRFPLARRNEKHPAIGSGSHTSQSGFPPVCAAPNSKSCLPV